MSLWFPLYVNTRQIGEVCITRDADDPPDENGLLTYDWTVVRLRDARSDTRWPVGHESGTVKHNYKDGAFKLIRLVLAKLESIETI